MIHRLNSNQNSNNPFFSEVENLIIIFMWNSKGSQITKTIFKKIKFEGLIRLDLKKLIQSYSDQKHVVQQKYKHTGKWNLESRNKSLILWSINFPQGCQEHSMG